VNFNVTMKRDNITSNFTSNYTSRARAVSIATIRSDHLDVLLLISTPGQEEISPSCHCRYQERLGCHNMAVNGAHVL
jgi:hypothetical protein